MADAVKRQLQTRIALKYDTYAKWTSAPGKDLVLLKGEMGICQIDASTQGSNVIPTVLFKIGDGNKSFENLPWASAKAADVYAWAKASDISVTNDNKLVLAGGAVDANGNRTDKVLTFNYITPEEVDELLEPINDSIETINTQIAAIGTRLDEHAGGISANASRGIANATAISNEETARIDADTAIRTDVWEALGDEYKKGTGTTVKDAITAVDTRVTTLTEGQVATNTSAIENLVANLAKEVEDRGDADSDLLERIEKVEAFFDASESDHEGYTGLDKALDTLVEIQNYLSGDGSDAGDVFDQIAANANAIDVIEGFVNAEGTGTLQEAVEGNTSSIATNAAAIAVLESITKSYLEAGEDAILDDVNLAKEAAQDAANAADVADGKAVTAKNAADAAQAAADAAQEAADAAQDTADQAVEAIGTANSKIDEIEAKYVAAADLLIIDCGTASTCTFTL